MHNWVCQLERKILRVMAPVCRALPVNEPAVDFRSVAEVWEAPLLACTSTTSSSPPLASKVQWEKAWAASTLAEAS